MTMKWIWMGIGVMLALSVISPNAAGAPADALRGGEAQEEAELVKMAKEKPQQYREYVAMMQMALGAFGFGTGPFDGILDERTIKAIRTYQGVRGLPQTGRPNSRTAESLMGDYELWTQNPPLLPKLRVFLDTWDQGYVSAEGTWIIEGEKSGRPIQTSRLECHMNRKICTEATTHMTGNYLSVGVEEHSIERWDSHEIVTKPSDSGAMRCVRYTTRIGRTSRTVTGLRLRISEDGLCKDFTPELRLRLVDGMEVTNALRDGRHSRLKSLMQAPPIFKNP